MKARVFSLLATALLTSAAPAPLVPNDPLFAQQWYWNTLRLPEAWAITQGSFSTTVAVLDTGQTPHDELLGRQLPGYDFVSDPQVSGDGDGRDPDPRDPGDATYHGTQVAGLIAARGNDRRGMAGANWRARVVHARVADRNGQIRAADFADALRWAAGIPVAGVPRNRTPARVINASLFVDFIPLTGCDPGVQAALDEVAARGVVVVAGAANDDADARGYTPAGCRGVITVTATDRAGRRAPYANHGPAVSVAAPGGDHSPGGGVISSYYGAGPTYTSASGTSFAAPMVSGVVSLMLALKPTLTPTEVKAILERTATRFPGGVCDALQPYKTCGAGIVNARAALEALGGGGK
ncbi:serine protease [Deinobacterium chartae]|uniref:Serine protease n=1 Tax=Deinobacterium chartae TaxID=521158 RepID=A0A841HYF5_9DEIO|nr:S8 family serine peptidase [Deinobacterium chartae]MBB6098571.1 serine protease [Deinobacterium chartae]